MDMNTRPRGHLLTLPSTLIFSILLSGISAQQPSASAPSSIPTAGPSPISNPASSTPLITDADFDSPMTTHGLSTYVTFVIFLIVITLGLSILFLRARQRRHAVLLQTHSVRALEHDVEGLRSGFTIREYVPADAVYHSRRTGGGLGGMGVRREGQEGLNERGEAPPPYDGRGGRKPPAAADVVELGNIGSEQRRSEEGFDMQHINPNTAAQRPEHPPIYTEPSNSNPAAIPPTTNTPPYVDTYTYTSNSSNLSTPLSIHPNSATHAQSQNSETTNLNNHQHQTFDFDLDLEPSLSRPASAHTANSGRYSPTRRLLSRSGE